MSSTPATEHVAGQAPAERPGERRVRHQAREALAVMAFSGLLSLTCAVVLLLLTHLGR